MTVRPVPRSLLSTDGAVNTVFAVVEPVSFTATGLTVSMTFAVDVCPAVSAMV